MRKMVIPSAILRYNFHINAQYDIDYLSYFDDINHLNLIGTYLVEDLSYLVIGLILCMSPYCLLVVFPLILIQTEDIVKKTSYANRNKR
jgi:hypothetical protein